MKTTTKKMKKKWRKPRRKNEDNLKKNEKNEDDLKKMKTTLKNKTKKLFNWL